MKKYGSNITVTSNEKIALKDGTQAYRTDFESTMQNNQLMMTNLVSAYKNGKCIYIAVHEFQRNQTIKPIVQSWTFK